MNQLKGRFAAQQILGGRAYQQDDYGLIERGDPDASLEEIATALIHAVEEARHPCQDNTTVLLYKPEADFGEGMLPENQSQKQAYRDSGLGLRKYSQKLLIRLDLLRVEIILYKKRLLA